MIANSIGWMEHQEIQPTRSEINDLLPKLRYGSPKSFVRFARSEIYESQVRPKVEADNHGKIVVIDSDDRVEIY